MNKTNSFFEDTISADEAEMIMEAAARDSGFYQEAMFTNVEVHSELFEDK